MNCTHHNIVAQDQILDSKVDNLDISNDPTLLDPDSVDPHSPQHNERAEPKSAATEFNFTEEHEAQLLGHITQCPAVAAAAVTAFDPKRFTKDSYRIIARLAMDYYEKYSKLMPFSLMEIEFKGKISQKSNALQVAMLGEFGLATKYAVFDAPEFWIDRIHLVMRDAKILESVSAFAKDRDATKFYAAIDEARALQGAKDFDLYNRPKLRELEGLVWQVAGHFPKKSTVCIFGPSGSGKSFYALDISMCVTKGDPFLGKYHSEKGTVLYINSEGSSNIDSRLTSWLISHGYDRDDDCDGIVFSTITHNFKDRAEIERLIKKATDMLGKIDLVVIDTLSRNFGDGDTDHNADMQEYLKGVDFVRESTGATVVSIHHTGWGNVDRERGAKSLRDYCDSSIAVIGDEESDQVEIMCKKQKDDAKFATYTLIKTVAEKSLWLREQDENDVFAKSSADSSVISQLLTFVPMLPLGTEPTPENTIDMKKLKACAKQLKIKDRAFKKELNDLLTSQAVLRARLGSASSGYRYYQISDLTA